MLNFNKNKLGRLDAKAKELIFKMHVVRQDNLNVQRILQSCVNESFEVCAHAAALSGVDIAEFLLFNAEFRKLESAYAAQGASTARNCKITKH